MSDCQLTRADDGTISCPVCLVPYTLGRRELARWGGDLSMSQRPCLGTPELQPTARSPRPEQQAPPSFLRRLGNFSVASIKHTMAGLPTCTQEEIDARHAVCKGCELYRADREMPDLGICTHESCGCPIKMANKFLSKLAWRDQQCPLAKWPNDPQA